MKNRRNEYDVTNDIRVSDAAVVNRAVREIFADLYPNAKLSLLDQTFEEFERLFTGRIAGYQACDTLYHDQQHSLDMTLAMMRLVHGYERSQSKAGRFGPKRTLIGLITALFHDSGYIRKDGDSALNGAEYTKVHVTRSADFLTRYLSRVGLAQHECLATQMVHYTGYEIAPESITLRDPKFHTLGFMLGSADLIAQLSDRCYLEKCRDRLYPEFVIAGIARQNLDDGREVVIYDSGNDLLKKTPAFFESVVMNRLIETFKEVYRYAETHFDGSNYYMDNVLENQRRLHDVVTTNRLESLTRRPPPNFGTRKFRGLENLLKKQHNPDSQRV